MTVLVTKYNKVTSNLIEATLVDEYSVPNDIYAILQMYNYIELQNELNAVIYEIVEKE